MATPAQITANQTNAQSSTGPRTQEGKTVSSQNARRHGLTAKTLVLETEDRQAYIQLRADLAHDYQPKGDIENSLLDALAESTWRLLRLRRLETAFHDQAVKQIRKRHPHLDADQAMAHIFIDPQASSQLRLFLRYQTPIERAWREAEKRLVKMIQARIEQEKNRRASEAMRSLSAPVGFVSQSAPAPVSSASTEPSPGPVASGGVRPVPR